MSARGHSEYPPDSSYRGSKVHCRHDKVECLGVGMGTNGQHLPNAQLYEGCGGTANGGKWREVKITDLSLKQFRSRISHMSRFKKSSRNEEVKCQISSPNLHEGQRHLRGRYTGRPPPADSSLCVAPDYTMRFLSSLPSDRVSVAV